jgi:hypothetical protein
VDLEEVLAISTVAPEPEAPPEPDTPDTDAPEESEESEETEESEESEDVAQFATGTPEAVARLAHVCQEFQVPASLDGIYQAYVTVRSQRDKYMTQALKAISQARKPASVRPEDVPLEVACQVVFGHCYFETQEQLTIGVETMQQPLHVLMVALLSHLAERGDVTAPDLNNVPPQVFHNAGSGRLGPQQLGVHGQLSSQQLAGSVQRPCEMCGTPFEPAKGRPHQRFHGDACGEFEIAIRTWANNVARFPDMRERPLPEPYQFAIPPDGHDAARAWRETWWPIFLAEAQKRVDSLYGVSR